MIARIRVRLTGEEERLVVGELLRQHGRKKLKMVDLEGAHAILPPERQVKIPYSRLRHMQAMLDAACDSGGHVKALPMPSNGMELTTQIATPAPAPDFLQPLTEKLLEMNRLAIGIQEASPRQLREGNYLELKRIQSLCIHASNGLTNFEELLRLALQS